MNGWHDFSMNIIATYATLIEPWSGGQTPVPIQDCDACPPRWGRRHVQVGLTIVFVLAAGSEVLR
jgi:hypothetical protein